MNDNDELRIKPIFLNSYNIAEYFSKKLRFRILKIES